MKLQYLGDSKDSFKWDYHDYLASELKCSRLTVALMLTPDDASDHGKTRAEWYPARTPVLQFCRELKNSRDIEQIKSLPRRTGASYDVVLHKNGSCFTDRTSYFSGFESDRQQIVFLDPDNGFEPQRSCNKEHVGYRDVTRLLAQLESTSIVSVFHHFRRVSFADDFERIRARLGVSCHKAAIYWHSLMFVAISRSESTIGTVIAANKKYAENNPVKVIS